MKRFVYFFGLFIVVILFFFQYDNFNSSKYYQMLSLNTYLMENESSKPQVIEISNFNSNDNRIKTFSFINEVAEQNKTSVMVRELVKSNNSYNKNRYYLYTVDNIILNKLNLKNNSILPFDNSLLNFYYSTDANDVNKKDQLLSFNEDYFVKESECIEIYPLQSIVNVESENKVDSYWISVSGVENKQLLLENINNYQIEENISFTVSDITETLHYWDFNELLNITYSPVYEAFLICLAIFIISECCIVSKNNKELIIRKMHGESTVHIIKNLYGKFFAFLLLSCLGVHFLLWYMFVNSSKLIYKEFNYMVLKLALLYIIFAIVLFLILYIYIQITANIKHLKKDSAILTILRINILFKICICLFMIAPFLFMVKVQLPVIKDFLFMLNNRDYFENSYTVGSINNRVLEEFLLKYPYVDFSSYAMYGNSIDINFPELTDEQIKQRKMNYPYIVANELYLSKKELYNTKGEAINFNMLKNNTLLVPENLQGKNLNMYCNQGDCDYIYVKQSKEFINENPLGQVHRVKNPIIRFIKENRFGIVNHQAFFIENKDEKSKSFIENSLNKEFHIENTILMSNSANFLMYINRTEKALFSVIVIFIVYTLIFILFLIQFLYLFFEKNKKELVIQYILGLSFFDRYGSLFLIDLLIYGIVSTLCVLLLRLPINDILVFITPILTLDVGIQLLYIQRFHNKNAATVLKGDN